MSNNEQQRITCAYGFDKLTPAEQRIFQDFLRVLKTVEDSPLYPTFTKEKKDELFKRIWGELKTNEHKQD